MRSRELRCCLPTVEVSLDTRGHTAHAHKMLTGRDAEMAERLREAAASGLTQLCIQLLESGAPFIVDSVSVMRSGRLRGQ